MADEGGESLFLAPFVHRFWVLITVHHHEVGASRLDFGKRRGFGAANHLNVVHITFRMDAPRRATNDAFRGQAEIEQGERQAWDQRDDSHNEASIYGEMHGGSVHLEAFGICWWR